MNGQNQGLRGRTGTGPYSGGVVKVGEECVVQLRMVLPNMMATPMQKQVFRVFMHTNMQRTLAELLD